MVRLLAISTSDKKANASPFSFLKALIYTRRSTDDGRAYEASGQRRNVIEVCDDDDDNVPESRV